MADDPLHPLEAAQRQRTFILWVVRAVFLLLILAVSLLALIRTEAQVPGDTGFPVWTLSAAALGMFLVAIAIDILTPNKKASTLAGALIGVLAGLLATLAIGFVLDLAVEAWVDDPKTLAGMEGPLRTLKIMLGVTLCYLGVSTVLQTQDDFRLVIPYVEFSKQLRGPRPLLLDSSALIDARIADVAATGIIQAPLVIARFVIAELQLLADTSDKLKRSRGRRGLDIIATLQRIPGLDVTIDETRVPGKSVDPMLIELAKRMNGAIVTTDSGLSRVAQIQDVGVINVNDLANALKQALVPGEPLSVHVVRPGEQPGQGVGYLEDGTMIVVEGGASRVGTEVRAEVTGTLQTSAGRMIFSRMLGEAAEPSEAGASGEPVGAAGGDEQHAAGGSGNGDPGSQPADSNDHGERSRRSADGDKPGPFPPTRPRKPNPARNPRR